ncbi:MAG: hypothetical protein AAGH40_05790 [Verrucomicrobiota bacterium]
MFWFIHDNEPTQLPGPGKEVKSASQQVLDLDQELEDLSYLSREDQLAYLDLLIDSSLESIREAESGSHVPVILKELKMILSSLPQETASQVIQNALAKQLEEDLSTGLDFKVGSDGSLSEASSVRVALLDWLGQMDRFTAGRLAEEILKQPTEPDEWAISLRNYAWANPAPASYSFLRDRVLKLIENPEWRGEPTEGYLAAFDVLVYTQSKEAVPVLLQFIDKSAEADSPTGRIALFTLDQMVVQEPEALIRILDNLPELSASSGEMIAQMVARADLSRPALRGAVSRYLLDPARTDMELSAFAAIFPNRAFKESNNLLSETMIPKGAERILQDRAAYSQIEAWIDDTRFGERLSYLLTIKKRLESFIDLD